MIKAEEQKKTKEKKMMEATAKETYSHANGRVMIEVLESDDDEEEEEKILKSKRFR